MCASFRFTRAALPATIRADFCFEKEKGMTKQKLPPGLYQKNGSWHYRYYERTLLPGNIVRQVRPSEKLATFRECPRLSDVLPRYHEAAARISKRQTRLS